MSGFSDSWKNVTDMMEEDKKLIEELVTRLYFHLISKKELYLPEGENSRGTEELSLKQKRKTMIKQLINEFFENREAGDTTTNKGSWESINEASLLEKEKCRDMEICEENTTEENIKTGDKNSASASVMKTLDCEETDSNDLGTDTIKKDEEKTENSNLLFVSELCTKGDKEENPENPFCKENVKETNKTVVDENDNFILKYESPGGVETETNEIGLTPEEEEEIKSLIRLAESENPPEAGNKYENSVKKEKEKNSTITSIKTEFDYETFISESSASKRSEENYEHRGRSKECLNFMTDSDDSTIASKQEIKELSHLGAVVRRNKYLPNPSPPPMNDKRSVFYINRLLVPVGLYQERLQTQKWNPTQVLYELCCQCNWPKPEFRILKFSFEEGYWFSVRVKEHNFNSREKGRNKKEAKSLAAARVLKFLGFKLDYDPLKSSSSAIHWSEKYSDYNSRSLTRDKERTEEFRYSRSAIEIKTDIDKLHHHKRERSSSSESRNSKILRTSSPDKLRREIEKRKRCRDECSRPKSRREISPGFDQRTALLRMNHVDPRRPRLVHERIAVTHVYDYNTLHPYMSRSDRPSARYIRHPSRDRDREER